MWLPNLHSFAVLLLTDPGSAVSTILQIHAVSLPSCQAHQSEVACCSWTGHASQYSLLHLLFFSKMASAGPEVEFGDLITNKNSTCVIWEYFRFEAADMHHKQVLCKTCRVKVATSSGNTTNLYQHLKNHHGHLHDECMTKKSGEKSSENDTQSGPY